MKKGDTFFDMTKRIWNQWSCTAVAGTPTETSPNKKQKGEEIGFFLIWLVPLRLLGEKVRSRGVLFCDFWKGKRVVLVGYQFIPSSF